MGMGIVVPNDSELRSVSFPSIDAGRPELTAHN